MLEDTLKRFNEQFEWEPVVEHNEALRAHARFILCGMGGSHLGAWLLKRYGNVSNLFIHRDYGLPELPADIYSDALVILSSYSGTTEEVLDSARAALERGLPMAAVSTGGKLIEFAREHAIPHVVIPETGLEPRMAIGFSMLAIARLMSNAPLESAVREAGRAVDPMAGESEGERISQILRGRVPLVYSSASNLPVAYIWKIKFNETAKIPSFCDAFPEMCHNELTGFDVVDATRAVSANMHAIFLEDAADNARVQKRMQIAGEMFAERGIPTERIALSGAGFGKAFSAALLADWISLGLARFYGVPNPETPMVAEFKHRIGQ
jgi:glucose/mannose-6-phosphate isomerase